MMIISPFVILWQVQESPLVPINRKSHFPESPERATFNSIINSGIVKIKILLGHLGGSVG